jgi:KDO2-lipid IV(A) lauroyltransferase
MRTLASLMHGRRLIRTGDMPGNNQPARPRAYRNRAAIQQLAAQHQFSQRVLQAALDNPRGTILLVPHQGNWEVIGLWVSTLTTMTSMYEPPKMAQLEHWIKSSRQRAGATLVPTNVRGVAALLKALRRGETTAILPDQVPPAASGDFSPIFGVPAQTMTLVHNLIQKSGSQVLLCTALRADGGWRLHFMPAAEAINSADQQTSLDALNRGVESIVALAPSQYQWEYKRFKARPEGLPSIYPKGS